MGSCAAPSAKGDDKFITTDYLQQCLLDSNIHLASFDDHYLYDSLSLRIDTVQQDNRQLAWHCYDLLSQLIDGQAPEPLQRYLPATLQIRHP